MRPLTPPTATGRPEVPGVATLRRLALRFRPHLGRTAGVFALVLLRSGLEIGFPMLTAAAIDSLSHARPSAGYVPAGYLLLVGAMGVLILARNATFYASHVAAAHLAQDLENELRTDLFRHVLGLRFRYHDENRSGKTIARSLRDMEKARHFFREVWFGYLEVGVLLAVVLAMVWWTHWSYGLASTIVFGLGITASVRVGRRVASLDREVSDIYDDVTTVLQESVAGARVVRAFGREATEVAKFGGHMDRFSDRWAGKERYWTAVMPGVNHLYHAALPVLLALGALRVGAGAGTVGEVAGVLLLARLVHHRIRPLTRLVILGQQATASASRVFEVLDETEVIPWPVAPRRLPARGGRLELEDVSFGHLPGLPVLRGVSLVVEAGGSLGILGPTGSGKSSLVQLLPRFYDPDAGVIRLDGTPLGDLPVHELRATVGLVFQEPFLFSGTVAENIAYGNPGASRASVERCARLAAAHDFVQALPDGYETMVGERGVSLSGGQQQRLTIARALAMDPRVLIFDDATASVDAVTERALFEGIRAAARGRTTLVISQRITSVRWCDRIALLDQGRIVDLGTHDELVDRSPLYQDILRHQQLTRVPT